jgi:hypothetical protein
LPLRFLAGQQESGESGAISGREAEQRDGERFGGDCTALCSAGKGGSP